MELAGIVILIWWIRRDIGRLVPELTGVPVGYLHAPWEMPAEVQQAAHCRLGRDYPHPIVDHAWARERALAVYRKEAVP